MEIPFFLAMTPGEQTRSLPIPRHMAHMSCHFSTDDDGLTDLPKSLPSKSILILDDSIPMKQHQIPLMAFQLSQAAKQLHCHAVLLDFQRVHEGYTELANALLHDLPCPMGITETYAKELNCPVFLSPPPLNKLPEDIAAPWRGRELWLDATCSAAALTVTESGCRESVPEDLPLQLPHQDSRLCCHYRTTVDANGICFTLHRNQEDLHSLIHALTPFGLTCAIGLYQEFGTHLHL